MLEIYTHDVGVLVVELVNACFVHNISGDEDAGEVGHESGVLSMLHVVVDLRWYTELFVGLGMGAGN